jgi:hypothetical protein
MYGLDSASFDLNGMGWEWDGNSAGVSARIWVGFDREISSPIQYSSWSSSERSISSLNSKSESKFKLDIEFKSQSKSESRIKGI